MTSWPNFYALLRSSVKGRPSTSCSQQQPLRSSPSPPTRTQETPKSNSMLPNSQQEQTSSCLCNVWLETEKFDGSACIGERMVGLHVCGDRDGGHAEETSKPAAYNYCNHCKKSGIKSNYTIIIIIIPFIPYNDSLFSI